MYIDKKEDRKRVEAIGVHTKGGFGGQPPLKKGDQRYALIRK